jgi:hypothetical protein
MTFYLGLEEAAAQKSIPTYAYIPELPDEARNLIRDDHLMLDCSLECLILELKRSNLKKQLLGLKLTIHGF